MLTLRSSPASPFGRKVKLVAHELGLTERLQIVQADTTDPAEPLRKQNPLGKIPTLILPDGTTLFDSRVIVEYLDHVAGGGKVIPPAPARFLELRMQALADGIMDAALLQVYEGRFRAEDRREPKWIELQAGKVARGLAALEAAPPALGSPLTIGAIAVACALGYLDLRFGGAWRADHPTLVDWLDAFAARTPAFEATRMKS